MSGSSPAADPIATGAVRALERKTLAERVAEELRTLILLEKLAPGAAIPERETAEALGVSRTPLRESLRMLATEGLVEIAPNRAPRVADPSLDELRQLLQVQGALEALAGELACANGSDAELAAIVAAEQEMRQMSERSADPLEFFKRDMAFHIAIVAASHNAPLRETHLKYNARLWRPRFISSRRKVNRPGTLDEHRRIAEALAARQPAQVSAALRAHLETAVVNIRKARADRAGENQETAHA